MDTAALPRHRHRFTVEEVGERYTRNSMRVRDFHAVCDCGWTSSPHDREADARRAAQAHRGPEPARRPVVSVPVPQLTVAGFQLEMF